jgi:hypothetical protein
MGENFTDMKNRSLTTAESKADRKRNNSVLLDKASEGRGDEKLGTNGRAPTNI